jgi:mono/diheme cytochrome c family protein
MAATDKPYRNQYRLDVVFGVSCLLLLLSTAWMLYDDHYRPFKPIQREFRDVEEALYSQQLAEKYPQDQYDAIKEKWNQAAEAADNVKTARMEAAKSVGGDLEGWQKKQDLEKARLEAQYQDTKATYDSEVSLYNIAVDERDNAADSGHKDKLGREAQAKRQLIEKLDGELAAIQKKLTTNQQETAEKLAALKQAQDQLTRIDDDLRKMTNDFDRTAKLSAQKSWGVGDWFRALPIIDGFASPYKIQQVALEDLTIEYGSFKNVPRYDRCTTCHMAIDRAAFTGDALRLLNLDANKERRDDLQKRYADARKFLKERAVDRKENLGFDVGDLSSKLPSVRLSDAQVKMYSAHPRLDLFVDSNSPHPLEKFGCTTCHNGQGSATEFYFAVHTPNNAAQKKEWEKEHHWEPFHDWEFPMFPNRFVEASCVKCHHQMTDLIRQGSQEEAPKLLEGYNLVKEYGCYGCHEISGLKSGKEVGPDLRLEPYPAMDQLTAEERAKILSDPLNPPGTLRKVGPSLRRISEKTNEEWARKWINSPRGFRPDTRMPHFYNLSTNNRDVLPDAQKDFPATEITSIAHYLFAESRAYLTGTDRFRQFTIDRLKYLQDFEQRRLLDEKQAKELIEVRRRLELMTVPTPIVEQIVDADGKPIAPNDIPPPANDAEMLTAGRRLFTERGCLACHSHDGTEKAAGNVPAVAGEAHFGPNLSRLAAKVSGPNGRRWLIQWVLNPNMYHPRTRMPITHLSVKEAGQVADWLLSQKVNDPEYQEWNAKDVPQPTDEMLKKLAAVYLKKAPAVSTLIVDRVLNDGFMDIKTEAPLMADDADEQVLTAPISSDKLQYYIGKKAVGRMGCFACHDIPGFEYAKPIGTPLNDWGKKDPARLAFEDIDAYVKDHYTVVPSRDAKDNSREPSAEWIKVVKDGKKPYEQFFADALFAHTREGFLHQKIEDPRSYDYNRDLKWDDRARMPQFRFAHPKPEKDESPEDALARTEQAEAQTREAVMTFILGLVADPIHARYQSRPAPDRLAEVKGRQVLEKFNCAGCHLMRSGVYDIKLDSEERSRTLLQASYKAVSKDNFASDFTSFPRFREHDAWTSNLPLSSERLTVLGTDPRTQTVNGEDLLFVRLTDAARFESLKYEKDEPLIGFGATGKAPEDGYREVLSLPAGNDVRIDTDKLSSRSDPWGGRFAQLLVPYLIKVDPNKYKNEEGAFSALPPPLVREGERVQPEWLYGFLRNPTPLRPGTVGSVAGTANGVPVTVGGLRMPKFNMSEDEAQAIVNYFAAADKIHNSGIGLTYPYVSQPERQPTYWRDRNRDFVKHLAGAKQLDKIAGRYRDDLKKQLEATKDGDRSAVQAELDRVKKGLAEKDAGKQQELLSQTDLYWADAYRLLTMSGKDAICLKCHNIGSQRAADEQGPPLDLAWRRLRPDWTERWLGNPKRIFSYTPTMPQPFSHGKDEFQEFFAVPSIDKVRGLRDVLMNYPKVADLPVNRTSRAATSGEK